MQEQLHGGCMCGGVRYVINAKPLKEYYCHCNDCKKSTGSAFHVGLVVSKDSIDISATNLKSYTKLADSGNQMTRSFCGNCGSPLFTQDSGAPQNLVVKAGSLDELQAVKPTAELWAIRKVSWAQISDNIRSFEKGKAYEI